VRSFFEINEDQKERSNALFEMVLELKATRREGVGSLHSTVSHPEQDMEEDSKTEEESNIRDVLATLARPIHKSTSWEQPPKPSTAREHPQTVHLRSQIDNATSKRQSAKARRASRTDDPLGTLLRARTMPVEPQEIGEKPESSNDCELPPHLNPRKSDPDIYEA